MSHLNARDGKGQQKCDTHTHTHIYIYIYICDFKTKIAIRKEKPCMALGRTSFASLIPSIKIIKGFGRRIQDVTKGSWDFSCRAAGFQVQQASSPAKYTQTLPYPVDAIRTKDRQSMSEHCPRELLTIPYWKSGKCEPLHILETIWNMTCCVSNLIYQESISNGVAAPPTASEALHWCLGVACPLWHEKDEKVHKCLNGRALVHFSTSECPKAYIWFKLILKFILQADLEQAIREWNNTWSEFGSMHGQSYSKGLGSVLLGLFIHVSAGVCLEWDMPPWF